MQRTRRNIVLNIAFSLSIAAVCGKQAQAQQTPVFTPGNIVVLAEGCGVQNGFCYLVPNSNAPNGVGYGDNQATPVTLLQYAPTGTSSLTYVNSLVLPQSGYGANLPVSGEYGSSSEGGLHLSGNGQYLAFALYGLNAAAFNASPSTYGATAANKNFAFAQTVSLTGQSGITPVPRVAALIDAYGNVNSSSVYYNIFNLNNPRSVFTPTGASVYLSGQGNSGDTTGGVFYAPLYATNNAPTAITGTDVGSGSTAANQDTRDVQIYNNTLYVSLDSTQGSGSNRSYLGTLGTPPPTTLYNSNGGPTQVVFYNNASTPVKVTSTGKLVLTASETNGLNASGQTINLSASGYFFANATTLYIADTGEGKQTSASTTLGDGGLQKWIYNASLPGWQLAYTLSAGLNLVANATNTPANVSGTTGLYAVTGVVSSDGKSVLLYATNENIGDLDPTYIYGFTDVLAATAKPSGSLVALAQAPQGSNFRGIAFAPTLATGSTSSVTLTTVPAGLAITSAGTGCVAGTYTTPVTLNWTSGSSCLLSVAVSQSSNAETVTFTNWQDGTTSTTYNVTAPNAPAVYRANFTAGGVAGLLLSGLADRTEPGVPQTMTVTAIDAAGNPVPSFAGTVSFTSTDPAAALPAAYTFQAADAGTHTFPVTLNLAGIPINATANGYSVTATSGSFSASLSGILTLNDVWALNRNDATVRLTGSGVATSTAGGASGTSTVGGVAFDQAGNAWVTQADTNGFAKYTATTTAGGTTVSTATSANNIAGLSTPSAVFIDGSGSAWFANKSTGSVSVVSTAGAAVSGPNGYQPGTLSAPGSLVVDRAGTVWVTSAGSNAVTKIFGAATPVATPLSAATANGTLGVAP